MQDDDDLKMAEDLDAICESLSDDERDLLGSCMRILKLGRSLTASSRRKLAALWSDKLGGGTSEDDVDEDDFV